MLEISVILIGIVIIVGFLMASKKNKREAVPTIYKIIHAGCTLVGAAIVLIVALMGDNRLWTNIILATIIVILGIIMAVKKLNKTTGKRILLLHASIGIICYALFVYLVFAPSIIH